MQPLPSLDSDTIDNLANSVQPSCNGRRKLSNGGRKRASVSTSVPA
jgi:hypothetical protein